MSEKIPIGAMFLGPKSENDRFFLETLTEFLQDHIFWRRNFHPEDDPAISAREALGEQYAETHARIVQEIFRLTSSLKKSVPAFSPRYLGHMTSDVMVPGVLGYMVALLYNPNNVTWEVSHITSQLEIEVGRQLAQLMGYGDTEQELAQTWGHLTSGGTIANLEALWVAHNIKYHALAIRNAARELGLKNFIIHGKKARELSAWETLNVPITETLELKSRLFQAYSKKNKRNNAWENVKTVLLSNSFEKLGYRKFAALFDAEGGLPETVILLPQTKHYSWLKGPEIFGIGSQQVIQIPVDKYYRQDLRHYRQTLKKLIKNRITPIMSVAVCGTTEESSIDQMAKMIAIRKEMEEQGLSYFLHCDAAWGGYARSVFLDKAGKFKTLKSLRKEYNNWPSKDVYDSFKAMRHMDSITVDPHKMGYITYPAGAIIFRDIRIRNMITHEAPYALGSEKAEARGEIFLGRYIMEGSKPGAAAAAVWLTHHVYPLNELGYGNLIGQTILAARYFAEQIEQLADKLADKYEVVVANADPDLNVVCYFFNPKGNTSLTYMNDFNEFIFRKLSVQPDIRGYIQEFYVSHTEFSFAEYNPNMLKKLLADNTSISPDFLVSEHEKFISVERGEIDIDDKLTVLRTTVMNPFIFAKTPEGNYIDKFLRALPKILEQVSQEYCS